MAWHMRSGYAIFTLLAFRLVWGFVRRALVALSQLRLCAGDEPALPARPEPCRTSTTTSATTRSAPARCSPCSAMLALQVATGLIADDEIADHRAADQVRELGDEQPGHAAGTRTSASGSSSRWWCCTSARSRSTGAAPAEPGRADAARRQAARRRRAGVGRQRPLADDRPRACFVVCALGVAGVVRLGG